MRSQIIHLLWIMIMVFINTIHFNWFLAVGRFYAADDEMHWQNACRFCASPVEFFRVRTLIECIFILNIEYVFSSVLQKTLEANAINWQRCRGYDSIPCIFNNRRIIIYSANFMKLHDSMFVHKRKLNWSFQGIADESRCSSEQPWNKIKTIVIPINNHQEL